MTGTPIASSSKLLEANGLMKDDKDGSFLISEDKEEDDILMTPAPAEMPKLSKSTNRDNGG